MKKRTKIIAIVIIIICLIAFIRFVQTQNSRSTYSLLHGQRSNICSNCGGSGTIVSVEFPHNTITCPVCNGKGYIPTGT